MKVLITGGAGFVGLLLAKAILARGELAGVAVDAITLFDQHVPAARPPGLDARVTFASGEIADAEPAVPGWSMPVRTTVLGTPSPGFGDKRASRITHSRTRSYDCLRELNSSSKLSSRRPKQPECVTGWRTR